jgi:hypothetical protein
MAIEFLTTLVPNTDPQTRRQVGLASVDRSEPTWAEIEQAIRGIDGVSILGVRLQAADDTVLSIGWAAGWYLCNTLPDMSWLVNPDFVPMEPRVGVIRQEQNWVSLDFALQAADYFSRIGGRDPGLTWVPYASLAR